MDRITESPNVEGRLRDLLRYYRREADGEEAAAAASDEPAIACAARTAAETWRRAASLLEAEIVR